MRQWEYKISLYRKGIRVSDDLLAKADSFHVYAKSPSGANFVRLTDDRAFFPSGMRSKAAKDEFIDLVAQELVYFEIEAEKEYLRQEKRRKALEKSKEKKVEKVRKERETVETRDYEEIVKEPEVIVPKAPPVPRVKFVFADLGEHKVKIYNRAEFVPRARRLIMDELDRQGIPYERKRHEGMILALYEIFKGDPSKALDPLFYQDFITRHIGKMNIQQKILSLVEKVNFWDTFNNKKRSFKSVADLSVTFRMKEIFSDARATNIVDPVKHEFIFQEENQRIFLQAIGEYKELVSITRSDLRDGSGDESLDMLREDIVSVFDELHEKGYFRFGSDTAYVIRLFVPLHTSTGIIQQDYMSQNGEQQGGGYSLPRMPIVNRENLMETLEILFERMYVDMDDYIKRSRMSGFVIGGFSIENLVYESAKQK